MNDSIRLGRLLGIPIGMNWSIVAVAAVFTMMLAGQAFPPYAPTAGFPLRLVAASIAVALFFGSILAHELGHAVLARGNGIGVGGITLWLLGGVAKLDRQAPTARAEFAIAVAGPAVSAALGGFFVAAAIIATSIEAPELVTAVLGWLGGVNLLLAVFNLLPAAPLDGGRILTAALWSRLGSAEEARVIAGRCGLGLGTTMVVIGLAGVAFAGWFGGWVTALVGAFVFVAARGEIAAAVIRRRLGRTSVGDLATDHPVAVPDSITVTQLIAGVGAAGFDVAHPVTRWDHRPIGYVVPSEAARRLSGPEQSWTPIGQVMVPAEAVAPIPASTSVDDLITRWEQGGPTLAVVVDDGGAQRGTLTDRQLAPLLEAPDLWGRDGPRSAPGARPAAPQPRAGSPGPTDRIGYPPGR